MLSAIQLAERLAEIVGHDNLTLNPQLEVGGTLAPLTVAPGSIEDAALVLRAAREAGAAVAILGGGTQQRQGNPPERLDLVIRTERLAATVEWEPADLTAGLQAGMTVAAAQRLFAERGQQLPIDAPQPDRATLGGLIATDTAGPRRWRYGGWRDQVIGMHMALCDGNAVKSGGRVVKNVQGYDLGKLFIGSLGTLGLIGQVNVKLQPLPDSRRLIAGHGRLDAACTYLQEVSASTARTSALDLLDEDAATASGLEFAGFAALILLEGRQAVVDAQSLALEKLARSAGVSCSAIEGEALDTIWHAWVDLGRTDDLGENEALVTVSALPGDVADVVALAETEAERRRLAGRCWARAGNGIVSMRLRTSEGNSVDELAAFQVALLRRWPATTLTSGSPALARKADPWGADPPGLATMRAIKQQFDPTNTLQAGRFVGGI